jgi:hypothetical protein
MSNDLLSTTFSIPSDSPSAYPSAYGALRGGLGARVRYLLLINEKLDQNDWRVADTRKELQKMMETLQEVENAVNLHNANIIKDNFPRFV